MMIYMFNKNNTISVTNMDMEKEMKLFFLVQPMLNWCTTHQSLLVVKIIYLKRQQNKQ